VVDSPFLDHHGRPIEFSQRGLDETGESGEQSQAADFQAQIRTSVLDSDLPSDLLAAIYAIQQEATIARDQYRVLLSRLRYMETQSGLQIADSQIVSAALVPTTPSYPNKSLFAVLALVLGVGLGVGFAVMNEFYVGGFTSESQLQNILKLPVAATIPLTDDKSGDLASPANQLIDAPLSSYSESIRRLRAAIDRSFRNRKPGDALPSDRGAVILVTSAVPEEGKSTTALALARTYALSGKKTLLIDGDLRKPMLHTILNINPAGSLMEFLKDPDATNPTNPTSATSATDNFYGYDDKSPLQFILGTGRSKIPTDQLLVSKAFEYLIEYSSKKFEVIVIDSPPLLAVIDAQFIAHHADAVVLVVRWAMTSQSDLRSIMPALMASKKPSATLIPVLSREQARKSGYYRGYYSRY